MFEKCLAFVRVCVIRFKSDWLVWRFPEDFDFNREAVRLFMLPLSVVLFVTYYLSSCLFMSRIISLDSVATVILIPIRSDSTPFSATVANPITCGNILFGFITAVIGDSFTSPILVKAYAGFVLPGIQSYREILPIELDSLMELSSICSVLSTVRPFFATILKTVFQSMKASIGQYLHVVSRIKSCITNALSNPHVM